MKEDPLAATAVPALVLAEAPEPEVKAESPRRPGRGAWLGQRFAFNRRRFISLGRAGLVDAASCRRQQRQLGGGALAVQQGGELPQAQVGAGVGPLTLRGA